MEAFISRKKRKFSARPSSRDPNSPPPPCPDVEDDTTEVKLATLASLFPDVSQDVLVDCLLASNGSVRAVCQLLDPLCGAPSPATRAARFQVVDRQSSLAARWGVRALPLADGAGGNPKAAAAAALRTRRGHTLHLYAPEDIALHTPCSVVYNFLPAREAADLLRELLAEAPTFERQTFKLFDNVVQSPHSMCFYVEGGEERRRQREEYLYNGSYLTVRSVFFHRVLRGEGRADA